MNTPISVIFRWLGGSVIAFETAALAISPADLQRQLAAGEKCVLVDVRPTALFKQGHIPNAINVPAVVISQKELPPMGRVVVYDDGLGPDTASAAAAALNQKNGVAAEVLEGGFAAWEEAQSATTKPGGMKPEQFPSISYERLKRATPEDLVLVDLREVRPTAVRARSAAAAAAAPLTDLQAEFPQARIARSPFENVEARKANLSGSSGSKPPLLVLIENGSGVAQQMARVLKANGIHRFAILAGGEEALASKGHPKRRRVTSVAAPGTAPSSTVSTNR